MKRSDNILLPLHYIGPVIIDTPWNKLFHLFHHHLSATDGLPPYSQAKIIDLIALRLARSRRRICLWVSVDAPRDWYFEEIKRLVKYRIPIAITPDDERPTDYEQYRTDGYCSYSGDGPLIKVSTPGNTGDEEIKGSLLSALQAMAHMDTAHTIEVASMTGYSKTHVRGLLKKLQAKNLIRWEQIDRYDGWKITNVGIRAAHRSWNVPKGSHFAQYRKEYRYAGERHRRTARMWRAWLEKAYNAEIWACWTEVPVQRGIPDALAWGEVDGMECLFWLEVDSGHSSKEIMRMRYGKRLQQLRIHQMEWNLPIIFCIMGPPWVVKYFPRCIPRLLPHIAMTGHGWMDFGNLPMYIFNDWNSDLEISRRNRKNTPKAILPFDPAQYPARPKVIKPKKPRKPKSKKEPYSNWNYDYGYSWTSDYHEE